METVDGERKKVEMASEIWGGPYECQGDCLIEIATLYSKVVRPNRKWAEVQEISANERISYWPSGLHILIVINAIDLSLHV